LWIGSARYGLLEYAGSRIREWSLESIAGVTGIQTDPRDGTPLLLDQAPAVHKLLPDGTTTRLWDEASGTPRAFHVDQFGRCWVATDKGLFVQITEQLSVQLDTMINKLLNDVAMITSDAYGTVWLETADHRMIKLGFEPSPGSRVPEWTAREIHPQVRDDVVALIARADQSLVRLGRHSIGMVRAGEYAMLHETQFKILAAAVDESGMLWLGTEAGGVHFLDLNKDGPPTPLIAPYALQPYDILFISPEAGAIWIATDSRILHLLLDPQRERVTSVTEVVRAPPGSFTPGNTIRTREESILAASDVRAYQINLDSYRPVGTAPRVYLQQISVGQMPIAETRYQATTGAFGLQFNNPEIAFRQNDMAFTFQGISETDQLTYSWRLPPLYPEWSNPSSRNAVQFAGLPPGLYSFEVMVCNDRGRCGNLEKSWQFTIRPSLRHRAWFWASCALAALLLGWWVAHRRIRQIRTSSERERARLDAQLRALTLEQKALRLQMNPHFMFNAVQTIQQQIRQGRIDHAGTNLGQFARLMRATLEMSRQDRITLEDEIAYLEAYLSVEQICHPKPLTYRVSVAEGIEPFAIELPPMLLQPLVENAVKHGTANANPQIEVL
ncbi:MAG: histidine kinase, partial [Saprospiraceae bacterium]|nr:histidine kinase [Saprospiraceae bacterium]